MPASSEVPGVFQPCGGQQDLAGLASRTSVTLVFRPRSCSWVLALPGPLCFPHDRPASAAPTVVVTQVWTHLAPSLSPFVPRPALSLSLVFSRPSLSGLTLPHLPCTAAAPALCPVHSWSFHAHTPVGASGPWTTNGQTTAESSPGKLTVAAIKITSRNLSPGVSPVSPPSL